MSRWMARNHGRQRSLGHGNRDGRGGRRGAGTDESAKSPSLAGSRIALFAPWVAMVIVTATLPIAGHVLAHKPNPGKPLWTLPEVQIRDDRAYGGAVWKRQGHT